MKNHRAPFLVNHITQAVYNKHIVITNFYHVTSGHSLSLMDSPKTKRLQRLIDGESIKIWLSNFISVAINKVITANRC